MDKEYNIEELKSFNHDDIESIRILVGQMSSDGQELSEQDLQNLIDAPTTHLYVARIKDSGQIIGMITLTTYRIPYTMKGWIEDVVVDEKHRGKGIATNLMSFAIEEAKKYQVKSLNLTSNPTREGANSLYLKLGFVKRETNVYRMML